MEILRVYALGVIFQERQIENIKGLMIGNAYIYHQFQKVYNNV
jgi:hypothetical protein